MLRREGWRWCWLLSILCVTGRRWILLFTDGENGTHAGCWEWQCWTLHQASRAWSQYWLGWEGKWAFSYCGPCCWICNVLVVLRVGIASCIHFSLICLEIFPHFLKFNSVSFWLCSWAGWPNSSDASDEGSSSGNLLPTSRFGRQHQLGGQGEFTWNYLRKACMLFAYHFRRLDVLEAVWFWCYG